MANWEQTNEPKPEHGRRTHGQIKHMGLYRLTSKPFEWSFNRHGGFSYSGAENLPPPDQSFLALIEHFHWRDIPAAARLFLEERNTSVDAIAKDELNKIRYGIGKVFGGYLSLLGAIPLDRSQPITVQSKVIEQLDSAVASNRIIEVFGRGTRRKREQDIPKPIQKGVGYIAVRYGLEVSPIGIAGTASWDPWPVHMHIGQSVDVPHIPDVFADRRKFVDVGRNVLPQILEELEEELTAAQEIANLERQLLAA